MNGVFVDTSALYAIFAKNDGKHREAVTLFRELRREGAVLVTSELVLVESYVLVHARTGLVGLLRFRAAVGRSTWLQSVAVASEHQAEAWRLLEHRPDKNYSFVDATSFVVMNALGLERAFTFDADFSQEGFGVLKARGG